MTNASKLNKLRLSTYAVFTLGALIILVDFVYPEGIINDEIINLNSDSNILMQLKITIIHIKYRQTNMSLL